MYYQLFTRRFYLIPASIFWAILGVIDSGLACPSEVPMLSGQSPSTQRVVQHQTYLAASSDDGAKIPLAIGSGLATIYSSGDTSILLALSDRGPNITLDNAGGDAAERVLFPKPDFNPSLYALTIRGSEISVQPSSGDSDTGFLLPKGQALPVTSSTGHAITGLPSSREDEIALDSSRSEIDIPKDGGHGIDPEAVTFDTHRKVLWVAEEYGPSLLAIDPRTRRIKKHLYPGAGLPELVKHRATNRGFEGLAYLPSDHLAAILQSPLLNRTNGTREGFVRLLILPATANPKDAVVTYPLVIPAKAEQDSYKIGELVALSNDRFLALEAYKSKDDKRHYHLILLDLHKARAIDSNHFITSTGKITAPIQRSLVLDFKDFSWDSGKIEGLALINKNRTLVVSKDNDFGITLKPREEGKTGTHTATFKDVPTEFLILDFPRPLEDLIPTR